MTNICQTIYCLANNQQAWAKQFIIWQRFPRHEKVCFYGTVRKLSGKLFATEMFATRATMVRQTIWQTICDRLVCRRATTVRQTIWQTIGDGIVCHRATTEWQTVWQTICNGIVYHPRNHGMTNYLANYLQRNCLPPAHWRNDKLSGKLFDRDRLRHSNATHILLHSATPTHTSLTVPRFHQFKLVWGGTSCAWGSGNIWGVCMCMCVCIAHGAVVLTTLWSLSKFTCTWTWTWTCTCDMYLVECAGPGCWVDQCER